jgi:DNA-binding phage protein
MARRSVEWDADMAEELKDVGFARDMLVSAVDEGAPLKEALADLIRAMGVKEFSDSVGIPSPNVLRAIHPEHNPTQETLERLLKPFGLRIGLAPIKPRKRATRPSRTA